MLNIFFRYYVCHYGPVGNYIGQQIYKPGRPCSSCPLLTSCSTSYAGLCSGSEGSQRNYTSSYNEARPRIETTISRVPRVISDSNSRSLNKVNIRTETKMKSSLQPRFEAQTINVQNKNVKNSRPQSNRYRKPIRYSRQRQRSQCSNILCRIANLFS